MLKICCMCVSVCVSVMPAEPSQTAKHTGSTGVGAVYRTPLTSAVSALMERTMQNEPLSQPLAEIHSM